jgi:hypothetical protein
MHLLNLLENSIVKGSISSKVSSLDISYIDALTTGGNPNAYIEAILASWH